MIELVEEVDHLQDSCLPSRSTVGKKGHHSEQTKDQLNEEQVKRCMASEMVLSSCIWKDSFSITKKNALFITKFKYY